MTAEAVYLSVDKKQSQEENSISTSPVRARRDCTPATRTASQAAEPNSSPDALKANALTTEPPHETLGGHFIKS